MLTRLFIVGIAIFLSGSAMLTSTELDWDELVGDPCYHPMLDGVYSELELDPNVDELPWGDAQTMEICSSDLPGDPCPGCCFTIVYHELYNDRGGDLMTSRNYYVNIGGIYWDNSACDNCDQEAYIREFYLQLIEQKAQDPSFFGDLSDYLEYSLEGGWVFPVFTKGKCMSNNDNPCGDGEGCCYHLAIAQFDTTSFELDTIYWETSQPLEEYGCEGDTCSVDCFDLAKQSSADEIFLDSLCGYNCDYGEWQTEVRPNLSPFPDCPQCYLSITYKKRTVPDFCGGYDDIRIESISLGDECLACGITDEDLMTFAIDYVVKDVGIPKVDLFGCTDKIRVAIANCWGFFKGYGDTVETYKPCDLESCCWAVYRFCQPSEGVYTREYIDGSMGSDTTCNAWVYECHFNCGLMQTSGIDTLSRSANSEFIYTGQSKSWTAPNPTEGITDLMIESSGTGQLEITIVDINGIEVLSKRVEKTEFIEQIPLDLSSYGNGVYVYRVYLNKQILTSGKISVLK
jgi:hypothetical protein